MGITARAPESAADVFTLRRRRDGGGTPRLNEWGVDSEYGTLRDVLLARPTNLRHLATSSLSKKYLREAPCDIDLAKRQHAELVAAYEHFGVTVHYALEDAALPMQVYTRDSSFMTPFGAVITNMANWWRRGENFAAIRSYEALGIPIYDMVTAGCFEGGDFDVIEPGCVLIGCGGERTQEEGARQVQAWFEAEGWETRLAFFDPYYVHIDLMVVMLAEKLAAVCRECTEPGIVDWLRGKRIEIIEVPFADTMTLGCNVMALGGDRVIAPAHSRVLVEQLKAHVDTGVVLELRQQILEQAGIIRRRGRRERNEPLGRLARPVTKINSSIPAATASSAAYWIRGLSTIGSISFGLALVAGKKRVPIPPTGKTALRTLVIQILRYGCLFIKAAHDTILARAYKASSNPARWVPGGRATRRSV